MRVAFDIGGTNIRAAIGERAETLRLLGECPTPQTGLADFAAALARLLPADFAPEAALSLAITGTAHPDTGVMTIANIPALSGLPLASVLSARLGRKVRIANDADCFALAEARLGAGRGHRVVFGAILGTGVGGGIIIDGRIHSGGRGLAGEWGHGPTEPAILEDTGTILPPFPCGCGQAGCLDTMGSAPGLARLHQALCSEELDPEAVIARWVDGDPAATRTVLLHRQLVSRALARVANILGPDIIPVGGGLGRVPELVRGLDQAVRRLMLAPPDRPFIVPAEVTALTPGLVGAALLED